MKERTKGIFIGNTSCSCGSSDGRSQYRQEDDSVDSFCWVCKQYFKENERMTIKKPETFTKNINEIPSLPILAIQDRKIRKEISELYDVHFEVSGSDATTITTHYYPDRRNGDIVGWEVKNVLDKKFSAIGDRKGELDLWGSNLPRTGKKLFITEGRLDAMSLYQAIVDSTPSKYKEYTPSVVSVTRGAGGAVKDIMANRSFVEGFEEVVLCFDMDSAGKEAVKEVLKVFPLFKVASYPLKDASDMLVAGKVRELYQACVWDSSVVRQGEVVKVDDMLIEEALTRPKMGLSSPWASLDKLTYGIRPHTITILGSAPKQGKSEFKNQLVHHLAIVHNRKVGVYDLEVHPVKTLKQVASKEAKTNFLRPDNNYEDELLKSTLEKFKDNLFLYDRTGSRDWEDIRIAIEEQYLLDGVMEFFLDPLTALISRYSSSEANDKLNEIMTDLADLVNKYPISVFCFSHINPKPKGVKSHEQGGKVLSSEFTGSRALEKWSNLGLGLERDRSDDCPLEDRNKSKVVILYDRDYGNYGSIEMFYNTETTEYLELW